MARWVAIALVCLRCTVGPGPRAGDGGLHASPEGSPNPMASQQVGTAPPAASPVASLYAAEKAAAAALKPLRKNSDDMAQVTWFEDRAKVSALATSAKFYFGRFEHDGNVGPLRMSVTYHGDNWVFAKYLTLKIDGDVRDLLPGCEWKHHVVSGGGGVLEWCDFPISASDPSLAKTLAAAKAVKIRFNGSQGVKDWVVPKSQLAAMKRVYAAWEAQPK